MQLPGQNVIIHSKQVASNKLHQTVLGTITRLVFHQKLWQHSHDDIIFQMQSVLNNVMCMSRSRYMIKAYELIQIV